MVPQHGDQSLAPLLRVGARCVVGGRHKGTVRYIGPVEGQSGEWVGVEWDDASRGKHDGSHGGRRYFSCASGSPAGSFVRLTKLLEAVSFGCTLLEALQHRYAAALSPRPASPSTQQQQRSGQAAGEAAEEMYVQASGSRRVEVQLVGADKVAQRLADLAALQKGSAVDEGVSQLGDPVALAAALPSLSELDLSDNLIPDWDAFVGGLCAALPWLRALNLSRNRLSFPPPTTLEPGRLPLPQTLLPGLTTLVLNGCGVGWAQAVTLARQLPSLRELHLCGNGIASLRLAAAAPAAAGQRAMAEAQQQVAGGKGCWGNGSSSPDAAAAGDPAATQVQQLLAETFSRLEVLDLEDNQLSEWGEVQLLSELPALRMLLLSGNAVPSVRYAGGFASLATLLLGRNQLADWGSIDQLDRFPALTDARLSGNPRLEHLGSVGRYEVIARVGGLTTLNASEVGRMERWDAELNYLRHVTDELAQAGSEAARAEVLKAHPRFPALEARYGQLAPSKVEPGSAGAGSSLARSMVELVLAHGEKEVRKKLPVSLTVAKLKLMIEKLLRVKAGQQALLLVPPPAAVGAGKGEGASSAAAAAAQEPEDITDEDSRELRYFSPSDGTRVEVTEADPAARVASLRAAKQAAAELHQLRMAQQEKVIQQFRVVEKGLMAS